jgi:putative endonuclease
MSAADRSRRASRRGADAEVRARQHLEQEGLSTLDHGWRCRLGELDLVMLDRGTLVFVEVRSRCPGNPVSALESLDSAKISRFVRAARAWLAMHGDMAAFPARFDIVAIDGDALAWHADAFSVNGH